MTCTPESLCCREPGVNWLIFNVSGIVMHFASDETYAHPPYLQITLDQFQLIGRSIAGIETVLCIPQWNLCFDAGRSPDFAFAQNYLALTHWHLDHAGGIAYYLGLRHLNGLEPLNIIMPRAKIDQAAEYLHRLRQLSESELDYQLCAAEEDLPLPHHRVLKGTENFHCTPSTGYLVELTKHHLKEEFQGKSADEIVSAKQNGIAVEDEVSELVLAVSGDSKGEFLETEAVKAKHLIMECSFFGDTSNYEKIRAYGHTHIADWKRYADKIASPHVIMSHTSQRYSRQEIEASCRKYLPKDLQDRLIVLR